MRNEKAGNQTIIDGVTSPLSGFMILIGYVLMIIAAVATPVLGEALFAGLLGKEWIKQLRKRGNTR